jgi:hypothetical protein
VATAIAAGLASLILSCHRLANPQQEDTRVSRKDVITTHFDRMKYEPNNKYILLERFGGMEERNGPPDVESIILSKFKKE